jgi:hypothetical protein
LRFLSPVIKNSYFAVSCNCHTNCAYNRLISPNYDSLTNVTDSAKQIKHELEWNKAAKAVATEELQVLDQLIIDDADRRLSSGTNFTEMSPTTEDMFPGQLMFEEITEASKGLGTASNTADAEIIQVQFACLP